MGIEAVTVDAIEGVKSIEGKYLIFRLGHEEYGVEILRVREIIGGGVNITFVPHAPPYVNGVINLRGKVIPVVDMRLKFNMPQIDRTSETCIIVVEARRMLIGVLVDTVCEVIFVSAEEIEPPPVLGTNDDASILGIGKVNGDVNILLDIEKVLDGDELPELDTMELYPHYLSCLDQ